jgi:thiamine biosynthesis lipoprotein
MINRLGSKKELVIGEEIFSILTTCMEYHAKTLGLFDIGIGKVSTGIRNGSVDSGMIKNILEKSGIEKISLDPGRSSVKFLSDQLEIDLGGFGKGYALDRLKSLLIRIGISDAFISFGDSSILALGNHPYGKGWKSGISHLLKPGESLFEFKLNDESLSTSGISPQNARRDKMGHILHPEKGLIETGLKHISVASKHAEEAEVLSTALMAATDMEISKILNKFNDCRAIEVKYDEEGNALLRDLNNLK